MDPVVYLDTMPRVEFHQRILRGVAKSGAFSWLVSFGAQGISAAQKEELCRELQAAGVPICFAEGPEFDRLLEAAARTICSRAVELR